MKGLKRSKSISTKDIVAWIESTKEESQIRSVEQAIWKKRREKSDEFQAKLATRRKKEADILIERIVKSCKGLRDIEAIKKAYFEIPFTERFEEYDGEPNEPGCYSSSCPYKEDSCTRYELRQYDKGYRSRIDPLLDLCDRCAVCEDDQFSKGILTAVLNKIK